MRTSAKEPRILLIEDEDQHAERIGALVKALVGCRVDRARDRGEAWEQLRDGGYQAVVLDLFLPGTMDGELLLERMRASLERPPGAVVVSKAGSVPTGRRLRAEFDFVVEALDKEYLAELRSLFRQALIEALKKGGADVYVGGDGHSVIGKVRGTSMISVVAAIALVLIIVGWRACTGG